MKATSLVRAGWIAGLALGVIVTGSQIQVAQQAPRGGGQRGPDLRFAHGL